MGEEYNRSNVVLGNLEILLRGEEFLDLTVQVEDFEFKCPRVVLAASSLFSKACLRSDMKEAKDGCVTLKGISVSTFKHILNSLYTGKVILTLDNFMDMWKAADQLQIEFMVQDCEKFVVKVLSEDNLIPIWKLADQLQKKSILSVCQKKASDVLSLNNFENIFKTALAVYSTDVVNACQSFMLNNFDGVSKMMTIMELPFEEFLSLIRSRDLNVSTEDTVLETVINWVEHVPKDYYIEEAMDKMGLLCIESDSYNFENSNCHIDGWYDYDNDTSDNNSDYNDEENYSSPDTFETNQRLFQLTQLLNSVRMSLVSIPLLEYFRNHPIIIEDNLARELIMNAILYKTTHYNHGQWPTAAIHRACSESEHCGIAGWDKGKTFLIITAFDYKQYELVKGNELFQDVTLVVFDNSLYATGVKFETQANSSLCVLSGKSWSKIAVIPGRQLILVPYDQCIFILSKTSTEIYQIFPKERYLKVQTFTKLPNTIKVQQAICFQRAILIFSSLIVHGQEKTAVHQLDILTKKLTELEPLNGSAEHLISFSDDNNIYVLQTSGDLWTVQCLAKHVTFHFLGKLWNEKRKLYGALTYDGKLILLGENSKDTTCYEPKAYFSNTKYYSTDLSCSNFIPVVLPKNILSPLKNKN